MEVDYGIISIAVVKKKCISKGLETKKTKIIVCNKDSRISQLFYCKFSKKFCKNSIIYFSFFKNG